MIRIMPGLIRSGLDPTTDLFASYSAFQPPGTLYFMATAERESPRCTVYLTVAFGMVSTCPGKIRFGLLPMTLLFALYSACQPPETFCWDAIADNVSPALTVYLLPDCAGGVGVDGAESSG